MFHQWLYVEELTVHNMMVMTLLSYECICGLSRKSCHPAAGLMTNITCGLACGLFACEIGNQHQLL